MKKRGIFVVVVALLLFLLASVIVQAEEFKYANEDVPFYYVLFLYNLDDDEECDSSNLILEPYTLNNKHFTATYGYTGIFSSKFDVSEKKGNLAVVADECSWTQLPLTADGCYVIGDEGDDGDNDCAAATYPAGTQGIINQDRQLIVPSSTPLPLEQGDGPDDASTNIFNCDYLQTTYDEALLCGEKEFEYVVSGVTQKGPKGVWQVCNELTEGKYVKVGGQTFHCALNIAYGYQWLEGFPNCAETECDDSKDICEGNNFNWLEDASENNCCGDDGIADLDTRNSIEDGNYVCLSSNKGLVGTPFDITQKGWGTKSYGESPTSTEEVQAIPETETPTSVTTESSEGNCDGKDWCWLTASGDPAFHIYTLKKPGEAAYDIVSNNDKWYSCKEGEEGKLSTSKFTEDRPNINKFYCYEEGNKWAWAECCGEGTECWDGNANGIKIRQPGEGLFNLPAPVNGAINFQKNSYTDVYGSNFPDFTGYDYLEFYFSFTSAEVLTPAKVILEAWSGEGKLFESDVLSYVVNGAKFEPNTIMHVKIPVSNWSKVDRLNFRPKPSANTITVTQVHLTKAGLDNPICSGETSSETSSWLPDLDYYQPGEIDGQKMCEALGMFWLGDEVEEKYRCCGDDGNEYYTPLEEALSGEEKWSCWNSAKLLNNQTVTNVQVELSYGQGEWKYNYPEEEVSGSVELITNVAGEVPAGGLTFKCRTADYYADTYNPCSLTCDPPPLTDTSGTCTVNVQQDNTDADWGCGYFIFTSYNLLFPCDDGPYLGDQLLRDVLENQLKPKTETQKFNGTASATSPVKLGEFLANKSNFVSAKVSSPNGKVYLLNPLEPEDEFTELSPGDLMGDLTTFYVMGESEEIERDYQYSYQTENLTFSCFGETCKIPIKGDPPYTIKNPHPQDYDLYYVNSVNGKELRVLIDKEKKIYARDGWLEAKRVPQQILFAEGEFWECGDNSTTNNKIGEAELLSQTYCGVKSGSYCDKETGWSNVSLPLMKYNELNVLLPSETMESISPSVRNHSASVVFGRNFLFNPWLGMVK